MKAIQTIQGADGVSRGFLIEGLTNDQTDRLVSMLGVDDAPKWSTIGIERCLVKRSLGGEVRTSDGTAAALSFGDIPVAQEGQAAAFLEKVRTGKVTKDDLKELRTSGSEGLIVRDNGFRIWATERSPDLAEAIRRVGRSLEVLPYCITEPGTLPFKAWEGIGAKERHVRSTTKLPPSVFAAKRPKNSITEPVYVIRTRAPRGEDEQPFTVVEDLPPGTVIFTGKIDYIPEALLLGVEKAGDALLSLERFEHHPTVIRHRELLAKIAPGMKMSLRLKDELPASLAATTHEFGYLLAGTSSNGIRPGFKSVEDLHELLDPGTKTPANDVPIFSKVARLIPRRAAS